MKKIVAALMVTTILGCSGGADVEQTADYASMSVSERNQALQSKYEDVQDVFRPTGTMSTKADFEAFVGQEASRIKITVAGYEAEEGGHIAKDVLIQFNDKGLGLRIDELRAWGLNSSANIELKETSKLADYIDAKGVSFVGLDTFLDEGMNAYTADIVDAFSELDSDIETDQLEEVTQFDIQKYEYSIDRLIIDTPILHPLADDLSDEASPLAHVANMISDMYMFGGANYMVMYNSAARLEGSQFTGSSVIETEMPLIVYEDWDRGKVGAMFVSGVKGLRTLQFDGQQFDDLDFPIDEMSMSYSMDSLAIFNFDATSLLEFMAKGEMPTTDDTDLLSLGIWDVTKLDFAMFDEKIYSIEETSLEMDQFHWFIPTQIDMSAKGEVFNFGGVAKLVNQFASTFEYDSEEDKESAELAISMFNIVKDSDIAAVSTDSTFSYKWSPETGKLTFSGQSESKSDKKMDIADLMTTSYSIAATIPNFDAFKEIDFSNLENAETDSPETLDMLNTLELDHFSYEVSDLGLLDDFFEIIIAMVDVMPEELDDPSMQMFKNTDAKTLRSAMGAIISLSGGALAAEIPGGAKYMGAVSSFIVSGGTLKLELTPEAPVKLMDLAAENPSKPEEVIEAIGFDLTHETIQ